MEVFTSRTTPHTRLQEEDTAPQESNHDAAVFHRDRTARIQVDTTEIPVLGTAIQYVGVFYGLYMAPRDQNQNIYFIHSFVAFYVPQS